MLHKYLQKSGQRCLKHHSSELYVRICNDGLLCSHGMCSRCRRSRCLDLWVSSSVFSIQDILYARGAARWCVGRVCFTSHIFIVTFWEVIMILQQRNDRNLPYFHLRVELGEGGEKRKSNSQLSWEFPYVAWVKYIPAVHLPRPGDLYK